MTTNVEDTKKFDDVMSMLGTGKWNIFTMTIVALWYMMLPAHYVGPSFLIPDISHTCVLPLGAKPLILSAPTTTTTTTTTTSTTTTTTTTQNPSTITYTTNDQPESERVSQCEYVMVMNDTEKVHQCTEWHFDNTTYGTTLTEEFKLVCDRRFLRPLYASIYFMGALVGLTFFGYVSDRYGRRVAITSSIYTYILLANILNWMPNFNTILALRFILGITDGGFLQPGYTLTMECFQSSHRSIAGLTIFLPWIFGLILMGGVFKLFLNWFWSLFSFSLALLIFIPLLWFIDESPRWLIVRGHHDRALQVLQKAARWNNTSLPPEHHMRKLMTHITKESYKMSGDESIATQIKHFFVHFSMLFRTRKMLQLTLCSNVGLLLTALGYQSISLSSAIYSSDPYIYSTLAGVVEIPGATLTIPFVNTFGRRPSNIVCMSTTGIFILAIAFIPKNMGWLIMSLALIGKMTISAAYQITYLHVSEVFPTEVRTRGAGLGDMMTKVGSITAPFIIDSLRAVWEPAPAVVVGCSSFLACIVVYMLPETRGAPLHDTVASLEAGSPNVRKELSEVEMEWEPEATIALTA